MGKRKWLLSEDEPRVQRRSGRLQQRGRDRAGDKSKVASVDEGRLHLCEVAKAPSVACGRGLRCCEYSRAPSVAGCRLRRCELSMDRVVAVRPLRRRYASVSLNLDLHYSPLLFPTMHVATDDPFRVRLVDAYEMYDKMPKQPPFRNA
ncbi:hypothetical protein ACLOJK_041187 [Asimina triloba]